MENGTCSSKPRARKRAEAELIKAGKRNINRRMGEVRRLLFGKEGKGEKEKGAKSFRGSKRSNLSMFEIRRRPG